MTARYFSSKLILSWCQNAIRGSSKEWRLTLTFHLQKQRYQNDNSFNLSLITYNLNVISRDVYKIVFCTPSTVGRLFCSITFPYITLTKPPIDDSHTPLTSTAVLTERGGVFLDTTNAYHHYRRPVIIGFSSWRVFYSVILFCSLSMDFNVRDRRTFDWHQIICDYVWM